MSDPTTLDPGVKAVLRGLQPLPIDAPVSARPGVLDHALANLLTPFRGCVLVQVPSGVNPDHAHVPLVDEASTPEFLSRLAVNNIAVTLGTRSGGLLAIRFMDRARLTAFLDRNPASRQTLITEHADGAVIWHTANVAYRLPLDLPGFSIKMTGNAMVFDRKDVRRADVFLHRATPTCVNLEDVDWGDDPDGSVDVWLTRLGHGEFYHQTQRGRIVPRRQAWANLLARRLRSRVAYEPREHRFYQTGGTDEWKPLEDVTLLDLLRQCIAVVPTQGTKSHSLITGEFLNRLIRGLRASLATRLPVAEVRLRTFARRCLIQESGANATMAELYSHYATDQRQCGLPLLAPTTFRRMIVRVLAEEPWLRPKSNSIPRPSGHQHGFRGLRLRDLAGATPAGAVDGPPGTLGTESAG